MVSLFPGRTYFTFNFSIQLFALFVAFTICYFAFKAYRVTKDRKQFYFGLGFILISLNLLAGAVWNILQSRSMLQPFVQSLSQPMLGLAVLVYSAFTIALPVAYMAFIVMYMKLKNWEFQATMKNSRVSTMMIWITNYGKYYL